MLQTFELGKYMLPISTNGIDNLFNFINYCEAKATIVI